LPRKSSKGPRTRTVRHELADGTVKTYSYPVAASPKRRRTTYVLLVIRDAIAKERGNGAGTGFSRAVGALFAWAVGREWIQHNPMAGVKRLPSGELLAWTEAEASLAIRELPEPLRRAVVLAYHTAQRRGDLVLLPWSAYDGSVIRLKQQKTGISLVLPVHPDLRAELEMWARDRQSTTILTAPRGKAWSAQDLSHALPPALQAIGLVRRLNIHGLRKLAATRLAEAGCSAHEIAAITGHKTLSMVQHYTLSADQERMASAAVIRLHEKSKRGKTKASG
jgi:integrase